jgi:hypothetical protein
MPGARLEKVFDEGFLLERPAQGPDGAIYFTASASTRKAAWSSRTTN